MRISDWSSDVCSSDLTTRSPRPSASVSCDRKPPTGKLVTNFPVARTSPCKIGSASCRARVCQYVSISLLSVSLIHSFFSFSSSFSFLFFFFFFFFLFFFFFFFSFLFFFFFFFF